jgi:O-antigen/teichoic acid export membrane protein
LSTQLESATETASEDAALGSRAVRGAALTFARYGGAQAMRLVANLIVTRLVAPEAMGLMALVYVLIQGLEMFSDIGVGPSIIRSKRGDDPEFLDTIWTVQLLRGSGIWVVASVAAWPFSLVYHEPMLAQLVPVAALNAVLSSLMPTKQWTLNRHLQLGRLVMQDLASQIFGLLVMIGLAYAWRSVWALVVGSVAMTAGRTTLGYLFLPGRNNRLRWEADARSELIGFGGWVFVSTMLTFLSQSADRLIFGKLLPMNVLGIYSIGKQMASAPQEAIGHIGSAVVFPYYSRVVTTGQSLPPVFVRARHPLLVLAGWGLAMLAAIGAALIHLLYDSRYESGGWVVQVLALGAYFNVLWTTNVAALLALGQSKWMAATTGVRTAAIIVLVPVGVYFYGFPGAVVALAVTEAVQLAFSSAAVSLNGLAPIWHDVPMSFFVLLTSGVGYWATLEFAPNDFIALVLGAAVVTLLWLPIGWPLLRRLLKREGPLFGEA